MYLSGLRIYSQRHLLCDFSGHYQWKNFGELMPKHFSSTEDPFGDGVPPGTTFPELMHMLHVGPDDDPDDDSDG